LTAAAEDASDADARAWRDMAHALLMSNEYLYVE
jgi:hypothetical protein